MFTTACSGSPVHTGFASSTHVFQLLWYPLSQSSNLYLVVHVLQSEFTGVHSVVHTQWSGHTVNGYVLELHVTTVHVEGGGKHQPFQSSP